MIRMLSLAGFRLAMGLLMIQAPLGSAFGQQSSTPAPISREQQVNAILAADANFAHDGWRAAMLAESPRHHDMITLPSSDGRTLQAFIVYPTTKDKVPLVMMVPEDQGLNDWARDMADQISSMGYIVIVPDLFAGFGPHGGGRSAFPGAKSALMSLHTMTEAIMTADQTAWADYAKKLPESNGKLAVAGFGWGGGRVFYFATQRKDLSGIFIFYDAAPPSEMLANITAPVYGIYAEDDPRVTRSLDATKAAMAKFGKHYEPVMYPGSEHMFVRLGEMPANTRQGNVWARNAALARFQELLAKM